MKKLKDFSVPYRVAQTANKINQSLTKVLKDFDVAPEQRAILDFIDQDNTLSQNELSKNLGKDKTTISRTLDALEKKSYIVRIPTQEDKRVKTINLTSEGQRVLDKTKIVIENFREAMIEDLSEDEVDIMFKLLDKISNNIDNYYEES
ncbi:MarR family transcriptional regulator [Halarcobacter sp.]|uniref:MarR family winged helix-turn-helix transcriptional regulator n=1 Tax=Halarcobacter sp. TaxID=2321133 RepID=UPI0029F54F40|nr:MarR family transcriptional regulator [Halarcobacter sp.]